MIHSLIYYYRKKVYFQCIAHHPIVFGGVQLESRETRVAEKASEATAVTFIQSRRGDKESSPSMIALNDGIVKGGGNWTSKKRQIYTPRVNVALICEPESPNVTE